MSQFNSSDKYVEMSRVQNLTYKKKIIIKIINPIIKIVCL